MLLLCSVFQRHRRMFYQQALLSLPGIKSNGILMIFSMVLLVLMVLIVLMVLMVLMVIIYPVTIFIYIKLINMISTQVSEIFRTSGSPTKNMILIKKVVYNVLLNNLAQKKKQVSSCKESNLWKDCKQRKQKDRFDFVQGYSQRMRL